ncbi:Oidioi.mRNA.OKI2018_I69.XSR.g13487.t1.cds [Oikopleura dioica]|uniref:Oidioi.mRNA.OKI2018_I69.XSR.g13487.t1.cds n=1 Tax=Oikopleura dioica TaxID=34765 RepID=A0ABN7S7I3_OIKDI|nr:Oidioi.mRNA.OKI2018_I69.XSR.g13487.t1.cds [Oikopleura dioica]
MGYRNQKRSKYSIALNSRLHSLPIVYDEFHAFCGSPKDKSFEARIHCVLELAVKDFDREVRVMLIRLIVLILGDSRVLSLPKNFLQIDDIKLLMRQYPKNKCLYQFADENDFLFEIAVFGCESEFSTQVAEPSCEFFHDILAGLLENGMKIEQLHSPACGTTLVDFLKNELEMHREAMEKEKQSEIKIPETLRDKLHGDKIVVQSLSSLGYYHLKFVDAVTKALEMLQQETRKNKV